MKKINCIVCFLFCLSFTSSAQNIGLGADAMYNFQTESIGAGARVTIFPNNRLSIVPQFSYYFPFNKINEYYAGLGLEYKIIYRPRVNIYAIVHGAYNAWLNAEASAMKGAQVSNWNAEAGLGISNNKCLRPFLEYRYNTRFRETHLRLGIIYIFGCGNRRANKNERCSSYN